MRYLFILIAALFISGCAYMDDQQNVQPYEMPLKSYTQNPIPYNEIDSIPNETSVNIYNPFPSSPENIKAGEKLYRSFCYHCHGSKFDGNSPVGESLTKKPADLKSSLVTLQSDKDLFLTISNGRGISPALKWSMIPEERWKVIIYIRSLSK